MGDIINGNKFVFGDGGRMVNIQVNIGEQHDDGDDSIFDERLLAKAIENCQSYFWSNSAYAVVYCICRDDYKRKLSQIEFEKMVEGLPYTKERHHQCTTGTIANAFSNNPIFYEDVNEWDNFNPMPRIIKLRDALRKELNIKKKL